MTGWIEPPDKTQPGEYWLTRRRSDAEPGYNSDLPDIRVQYRWSPENAWISGYYQGRQRREPNLVCLHSNNGWRLDADQGSSERDET